MSEGIKRDDTQSKGKAAVLQRLDLVKKEDISKVISQGRRGEEEVLHVVETEAVVCKCTENPTRPCVSY